MPILVLYLSGFFPQYAKLPKIRSHIWVDQVVDFIPYSVYLFTKFVVSFNLVLILPLLFNIPVRELIKSLFKAT